MAQRVLPGIGLTAFWDLGYDGWKVENDGNLLLLSALVQASVLSVVSATPGSPTDGDMHIFDASHPTQPNKLALRDNGAWVYVTPKEGAWVYNQATDSYFVFNGAGWAAYTIVVPAATSAIYEDQKAANTAGGTATSGSWLTRTLNTEVYDDIGISLASNQLTVAAGTYEIDATAPFSACGRARTRIRNITDGTTLLLGDNLNFSSANSGGGLVRCLGKITLAATKVLELQYRVQVTASSNGLGVEANFGEIEVYSRVKITKLA